MNYAKYVFVFLLVVFIQGCASTNQPPMIDPQDLYLDEMFVTDTKLEDPEQLFAVTPEMKRYVEMRLTPLDSTSDKVKTLIRDLFSPDYMNIHYSHDSNLIPAETFEQGLANCMSLTLLAYVLVDEAGLSAEFMNIEIEENWSVSEQFTQLNGHVNLEVSALPASLTTKIIYRTVKSYTVDFLPMLNTQVKSREPITKPQIIALFYNNRGAQELADGNIELAYKYFKQATSLAPKFASLWGNLASLYRQRDFLTEAEAIYQHAIKLEPNNLNTKENLALLYRLTGREQQANELYAAVKSARRGNPFYYSMLAEEALLKNNAKEAIKLFKQALKLNSREHSFYFGLAKSSLQLKQFEQAEKYLQKAKRLTKDSQQRQQYQSKLSALEQLVAKVY